MIEKKVKIFIATHKKYEMPSDDLYVPLLVGAEDKRDESGGELELGYLKDNTGDNISSRNAEYCELTGLYWIWKNVACDYLGLVHYRRYFAGERSGRKASLDCIIHYNELETMLGKYKVFVPKKRRYFIETLYSHYAHTHYGEHLDVTREVISRLYPEYLDSYDVVLHRTSGHMFNMLILEKNLLNEYCSWLFRILAEVEKKISIPNLTPFQGRFLGRIGEIIFNVWLEYQIKNGTIKKEEVKELPYIHIEKINWWKKGISFLKAKFMHKKYESGF